MFIASTLDWRQVVAGIELGAAVLMARLLVKTGATTLFSRVSGLSWRKGALTGVALMPLSVFSMMLLEQTRHLDAKLVEHLPGVAAVMMLLNVLGPLATQWALCRAGEAQPGREG